MKIITIQHHTGNSHPIHANGEFTIVQGLKVLNSRTSEVSYTVYFRSTTSSEITKVMVTNSLTEAIARCTTRGITPYRSMNVYFRNTIGTVWINAFHNQDIFEVVCAAVKYRKIFQAESVAKTAANRCIKILMDKENPKQKSLFDIDSELLQLQNIIKSVNIPKLEN